MSVLDQLAPKAAEYSHVTGCAVLAERPNVGVIQAADSRQVN